MNAKNNVKGTLILALTAMIWGVAFVAQDGISNKLPPFAVNSLRSLVAFAAVAAVFKLLNIKTKESLFPKDKTQLKLALKGGTFCGLLLAVSSNLQQTGITVYPEGVAVSARAGFLTALYVVIVPVVSVISSKKISPVIWLAVAVAVSGVYLLCFSGGIGGVYAGDLLMLACACCFSAHIMTVDRFCGPVGGVRLACIQFLVCFAASGIASLLFESAKYPAADMKGALVYLMYLGLFSSGIAYTLQIVGQRFAEPYIASLTMSLESVFAALGGWLILGNSMHLREIIGCVLVFAAIILAQIPELIAQKRKT